jgi:hypothetical protein
LIQQLVVSFISYGYDDCFVFTTKFAAKIPLIAKSYFVESIHSIL